MDWSPSTADQVTLSGDWSRSNLHEMDDEVNSFTPPFEATVEEHDKTTTSFLLARWNRKRRSGSEFDVQVFHDRNHQYDGRGHDKDESIRTTDVEFNQHLKVDGKHEIVWGGGFRQVRDTVKPAFDSWFTPVWYTARTYNSFIQDEIALRHDSVRLTAGSKLEWNSFSGVEVQPTLRVLWAPARTTQHVDGGVPGGTGALAQRARPVRARLDLRKRRGRGGVRLARGLAGIPAREADVLRGGLPVRVRHAAVGRRGVVLQRLRRSADDRDGRRVRDRDTDRRHDHPSLPGATMDAGGWPEPR